MTFYILKDGKPEICHDSIEWAKSFEKTSRRVAEDFVHGVHVSTVFLGLDHSFGGGPPLIFETMIFGGEQDGYQERYSTKEQALAGHLVAVDLVKGG